MFLIYVTNCQNQELFGMDDTIEALETATSLRSRDWVKYTSLESLSLIAP